MKTIEVCDLSRNNPIRFSLYGALRLYNTDVSRHFTDVLNDAAPPTDHWSVAETMPHQTEANKYEPGDNGDTETLPNQSADRG